MRGLLFAARGVVAWAFVVSLIGLFMTAAYYEGVSILLIVAGLLGLAILFFASGETQMNQPVTVWRHVMVIASLVLVAGLFYVSWTQGASLIGRILLFVYVLAALVVGVLAIRGFDSE